MRTLTIVAGCFIACMAAPPAQADITFDVWSKGPPAGRAIYTAGVIGAYSSIVSALGTGSMKAFNDCLDKTPITFGPFGEEATAFANQHRELWQEPAATVLIVYLGKVCGFNSYPPQ